ncbi:hypothetical protein GGI07_004273, partial [Coemansia sp. Benny D115]
MGRRYIEPQNMDASPLLGVNEYKCGVQGRQVSRAPSALRSQTRPAAPENICLNVRVLSRACMPQPEELATVLESSARFRQRFSATSHSNSSASTSISTAHQGYPYQQSSGIKNRPQTQRSQASTASGVMMMSPLVMSRPVSTWKRLSTGQGSQLIPVEDASPRCVRFSVTIGASGSTVEDLAHVIESAYSTHQRLSNSSNNSPAISNSNQTSNSCYAEAHTGSSSSSNSDVGSRGQYYGAGISSGSRFEKTNSYHSMSDPPLIICTALFKGSSPLLFSSNVQEVLKSGDTVTVYSSITCDDEDDLDDNDDCYGLAASEKYASGRADISYSGKAVADNEFLFVPLSTLPPLPADSHLTASAAAAAAPAAGVKDKAFAKVAVAASAAAGATTATGSFMLPNINQSSSLASAATAVGQDMPHHKVTNSDQLKYSGNLLRQGGHSTGPALPGTVSSVNMARVGSLISQAPLKARFINVLIHPNLLRYFIEFCALPSELALEPLLFILDVERFRHVQPSMARLLANYIYLSYIAPSAPLRINISSQMRDRIPWPFLPGWEHNPWVFDEILASVGFILKKHTLLRFERSPVGLVALIEGSPSGFRPEEYVKPLSIDMEHDPMVAIAEHFEPDIDVVIWVNELDIGNQGAQLAPSLSQLSVGFREQLLMRVAAQFVDEHMAYSLCDGYFHLVTHIKPLQKQRRIKKTRKIHNFFGDHPHEALLRQQLMAVVPPSSQKQAARAAAEVVARKRCNEEAHRRQAQGQLCRLNSISSSVLAEQKILAMDSDSDIEREDVHGWAFQAMHKPPSARTTSNCTISQTQRSWSDTDTNGSSYDSDLSESEKINGWPRDSSRGRRRRRRYVAQSRHRSRLKGKQRYKQSRRSYNNHTLDRALSMIGVSHQDSPESNSSESCSPRELSASYVVDYAGDAAEPSLIDSGEQAFGNANGYGYGYGHGYDHTGSLGSMLDRELGAAGVAIFQRKRRVDKLREFFGGIDPSAMLHRHKLSSDSWQSTMRSSSLSSSMSNTTEMRDGADSFESAAALTAEERNLLIRRRRKLKALLGVDGLGSESISASVKNRGSRLRAKSCANYQLPASTVNFDTHTSTSTATSLSTTASMSARATESLGLSSNTTSSTTSPTKDCRSSNGDVSSLRDMQIRQFFKIRDVLGESAPAPCLYDPKNRHSSPSPQVMPLYLRKASAALQGCSDAGDDNDPGLATGEATEEQRIRARWRRNKLMTVLGDVPTGVTTLYETDAHCNAGSNYNGSQMASGADSGASDMEEATGTLPSLSDQSSVASALEGVDSERKLAKLYFGPQALPIGSGVGNTKAKRGRRQRVKKLKSFFGQSLSSDAALAQNIPAPKLRYGNRPLDTVREEPETQSPCIPPQSISSTDRSYEFIPMLSSNKKQEALAQLEHTCCDGATPTAAAIGELPELQAVVPNRTPAELQSTRSAGETSSKARPLTIADMGGLIFDNGTGGADPNARAQFWFTASPESQASVVSNDKASRRASIMATLRASKASIIGSIKRTSPSILQPSAFEPPASSNRKRSILSSSTAVAPRCNDPAPGGGSRALGAGQPGEPKHSVSMSSPPPPPPPVSVPVPVPMSASAPVAAMRTGTDQLPIASALSPALSTSSSKLSFLARKLNKAASKSPALCGKSIAGSEGCSSPRATTTHGAGPSGSRLFGGEDHAMRSEIRPSPLAPPGRSSSIKPLSPLPPISPNNFQASFDRGMALREMVAVAEYISRGSQKSADKQWRADYPPRTTSAERLVHKKRAASPRSSTTNPLVHQRIISTAMLSASPTQHTRMRKPRNAFEAEPIRRVGSKSVHWFDSPRVSSENAEPQECRAAGTQNYTSQSITTIQASGGPSISDPRMAFPVPCHSPTAALGKQLLSLPPPTSAKSSMESVSMSIVLRSPSSKKPSIWPQPASTPTIAAALSRPSAELRAHSAAPEAMAFPSMPLSHKASITAVGGPRSRGNSAAKPASAAAYNNIVTIRARRSQSFAIRRKLERATMGRKRSNTIGSGRQTGPRVDVHSKADNPDAFPQAEKSNRRVKSMIVGGRMAAEAKLTRSRCVTVIPLHLELQRLLSNRRINRTKHSLGISRGLALNSIDEIDELIEGMSKEQQHMLQRDHSPHSSTPPSRMREIGATADALCSRRLRSRSRTSSSTTISTAEAIATPVLRSSNVHGNPPVCSLKPASGRSQRSRRNRYSLQNVYSQPARAPSTKLARSRSCNAKLPSAKLTPSKR